MDSIIGFGSPLVDILTEGHEHLIGKYNLIKGGMQMVDQAQSHAIYQELSSKKMSSGGSSLNCIQGIAALGLPTAFTGCIAKDELGDFLLALFKKRSIENKMVIAKSDHHTGRAISIISANGERSFATHLGAASELNASHIMPALFAGHKLAFIEGYLIFNKDLLIAICEAGKKAGVKLALDLASFNVVAQFKDLFLDIVHKYIDVVFANEDEAEALTGKKEKEALQVISGMCEIAVVKIGERGSLIQSGKTHEQITIDRVIPLDTTGAGDLYASGFLAGLLRGQDLRTCGEWGSLLSREVVQIIGTSISDEVWDKLKKKISSY
jgi:sugar/nucleoside kinase (ribokinase family)